MSFSEPDYSPLISVDQTSPDNRLPQNATTGSDGSSTSDSSSSTLEINPGSEVKENVLDEKSSDEEPAVVEREKPKYFSKKFILY